MRCIPHTVTSKCRVSTCLSYLTTESPLFNPVNNVQIMVDCSRHIITPMHLIRQADDKGTS